MKFNMNKMITDKIDLPKIFDTFTDYNGRKLIIKVIDINNRIGREIQGTITSGKSFTDYSCTLFMWQKIWRDKVPPLDPSKMIIG